MTRNKALFLLSTFCFLLGIFIFGYPSNIRVYINPKGDDEWRVKNHNVKIVTKHDRGRWMSSCDVTQSRPAIGRREWSAFSLSRDVTIGSLIRRGKNVLFASQHAFSLRINSGCANCPVVSDGGGESKSYFKTSLKKHFAVLKIWHFVSRLNRKSITKLHLSK